jgi:hypothetical protein
MGFFRGPAVAQNIWRGKPVGLLGVKRCQIQLSRMVPENEMVAAKGSF